MDSGAALTNTATDANEAADDFGYANCLGVLIPISRSPDETAVVGAIGIADQDGTLINYCLTVTNTGRCDA